LPFVVFTTSLDLEVSAQPAFTQTRKADARATTGTSYSAVSLRSAPPYLILFGFSLLSALPNLFSTPPVPDPRFSLKLHAIQLKRTTQALGVQYHVNSAEFSRHPVAAEIARSGQSDEPHQHARLRRLKRMWTRHLRGKHTRYVNVGWTQSNGERTRPTASLASARIGKGEADRSGTVESCETLKRMDCSVEPGIGLRGELCRLFIRLSYSHFVYYILSIPFYSSPCNVIHQRALYLYSSPKVRICRVMELRMRCTRISPEVGKFGLGDFTASAIGCAENQPGARNAKCLQNEEKWIAIDLFVDKHVLLRCALRLLLLRSNLR